jgi:hypothetical protein
MHRVWAENGPPAYITAAAKMGWSKKPAPSIESFDDLVEFAGGIPGGIQGPSPFPSLEQ